MTNPFKYSNDNKRYHTQNFFLKETFGQKVIKLSLNAGFSCPNRDGKEELTVVFFVPNHIAGILHQIKTFQ